MMARSPSMVEDPNEQISFEPGSFVDARDFVGKWLEAGCVFVLRKRECV